MLSHTPHVLVLILPVLSILWISVTPSKAKYQLAIILTYTIIIVKFKFNNVVDDVIFILALMCVWRFGTITVSERMISYHTTHRSPEAKRKIGVYNVTKQRFSRHANKHAFVHLAVSITVAVYLGIMPLIGG